jgi:predicted GNAT family N-acyltransferase
MGKQEQADFTVGIVSWRDAGAALIALRTEVFVHEQGVPPELEQDGRDPACAHVEAHDASGAVIGTGRLMPDGRIGRMAVRASWRGRGVGGAMLAALVGEARQRGMSEAYLHAQWHARDFYARHGFEAEGDAFSEAGIAHINMRQRLAP